MYNSFRPGDIVLAKVVGPCFMVIDGQISLGDARSYLLSTAENELGVVSAVSVAGKRHSSLQFLHTGFPLVPISWCEMQCQQTGMKVGIFR